METQLQNKQAEMMISEKAGFYIRIFVLTTGFLLLSRNINGWFIGLHEDNSALFSAFARNHIYYGLGNTRLFSVWDQTKSFPSQPNLYLNHPPLLSVMTAIPMAVFGDSEWVVRSVPIAAMLGSAWLLMVIISRLQSPVLGLLAGLFYVMLPVTAYFGRTLNHEPPVQFFSLLMLHGYLQWMGIYGSGYSRKAGAVYYVLGVVLGTGTGWAAAIMAGMISVWHIFRTFYNRSLVRFLLPLTAIPAVSLTAVVVHILWGCHWNIRWFVFLFLTRAERPVSWGQWFVRHWIFLKDNFSVFAIGAAVIYPVIVLFAVYCTSDNSRLRGIFRNKSGVSSVLLTLLQGLIWIFLVRRHSWAHSYWQYFIAPFFAVAMATVVVAVFMFFPKQMSHVAATIAATLIILPIPFLVEQIDMYYKLSGVEATYNIYSLIPALEKLNQYVPQHTPVMTSENYETVQNIGGRTIVGIVAQAAYYGNRPFIYSTDINEIETDRQGCAAYLLRTANDPNAVQLSQRLREKYKLVSVEEDYMIFLLNPHSAAE
jgi:4-amino-4-deoxy-L-arabinose transferase-like glycosyltransferase